jgi:hypothetical protein
MCAEVPQVLPINFVCDTVPQFAADEQWGGRK